MEPIVVIGAEFGILDKDLLPKSLKLIAIGGAGFDGADHELGRNRAHVSIAFAKI